MINIELKKITSRTNSSGIDGILTNVEVDIVKKDGLLVSKFNKTIRLNTPDFENFLKIEDVSKEQIISWVKNQIGNGRLQDIEKILDEKMLNECEVDISKLKS